MPVSGGTALKFFSACWPQRRKVERVLAAVVVDHHRVVDHQLHRAQRVDLGGLAAERLDGVAHRGQVDHAGHAGEVLQDHARRREVDVLGRQLAEIGAGQGFDLGPGGGLAVFVAQQVFEQDFDRIRQSGQLVLRLQRLERKVAVSP
jgi:hypothetical protein